MKMIWTRMIEALREGREKQLKLMQEQNNILKDIAESLRR